MAKSRKNLTRGTGFNRIYDLRGVGGDVSELVNMYVDYEGGGEEIETLPGFRCAWSLGKKIAGIYRQKLDTGSEYLVIHAGKELYRVELDSGGSPQKIADLASESSTAFTLGESLYILDGEKILELSPDGGKKSVSDTPYIPTVYRNGAPYEEHNLLTKHSYQQYDVEAAEEFTYGSASLSYSISDDKGRTCAVSGVDKTRAESLYIPSYKYLGGVRYAVTEILPHALEDAYITELTVAEGITKIGDGAVRDCKNLKRVILPSSISEIGKYAFAGASVLEYARLGIRLEKIGTGAFGSCPKLSTVSYEGTASQLALVEGITALDSKNKEYNVLFTAVTVAFTTHGSGFLPTSVYIDGESVAFTRPHAGEVRVELKYKSELDGKTVRIYGSEARQAGMTSELGADLVALYGSKISPEEAVFGCRRATVLDGRVFLSDNPKLPGTVLYSTENADGECNPYYFGSYDFITTGGAGAVSALLAASDSLIVTKHGEVGEGSILTYEKSKTHASPRSVRYKCTEAHRVAEGVSHATVYSGIPLFLSGDKIYRLGGTPKTLLPVTGRLPDSYPADKVFSLEWRGYLFLRVGESCFLLDKRGDGGFRTYPLSGIGSYKNSTRVYTYADAAPEGYALSDKRGTAPYESVMSELGGCGETVYYVILGGVKVAVLPTEELSGGSFYPADCALAMGERLYFGTAAGEICLFNNDKRGAAPDRIKNEAGFDAAEYERRMGDKIHPDFYDFTGHRIPYSLSTAPDGCEDFSSYKKTSPEGVVLEVFSDRAAALSYSVCRDGITNEEEELIVGSLDFGELDFSHFSFASDGITSYSLSEESTPWIRHGVKIREASFRAPIKIVSLSLGYTAGKKIKNQ